MSFDETDHGEAAYHADEGGYHGQDDADGALGGAPVLAKT